MCGFLRGLIIVLEEFQIFCGCCEKKIHWFVSILYSVKCSWTAEYMKLGDNRSWEKYQIGRKPQFSIFVSRPKLKVIITTRMETIDYNWNRHRDLNVLFPFTDFHLWSIRSTLCENSKGRAYNWKFFSSMVKNSMYILLIFRCYGLLNKKSKVEWSEIIKHSMT